MNLLSWWNSLGEVEKASRESITYLVLEAESIISEEHRSWTATASKQDSTGAAESENAKGNEVESLSTVV